MYLSNQTSIYARWNGWNVRMPNEMSCQMECLNKCQNICQIENQIEFPNMSDRMSEYMSNNISEYLSDRIPDRMQENIWNIIYIRIWHGVECQKKRQMKCQLMGLTGSNGSVDAGCLTGFILSCQQLPRDARKIMEDHGSAGTHQKNARSMGKMPPTPKSPRNGFQSSSTWPWGASPLTLRLRSAHGGSSSHIWLPPWPWLVTQNGQSLSLAAQGGSCACSTILEPSYFLYPLEMKDCNGKSLINGAFEQEHHL